MKTHYTQTQHLGSARQKSLLCNPGCNDSDLRKSLFLSTELAHENFPRGFALVGWSWIRRAGPMAGLGWAGLRRVPPDDGRKFPRHHHAFESVV